MEPTRGKKRVLPYLTALGLLLALGLLFTLESRPDSIHWERSHQEALRRAGEENRLILADMFTDWCSWCKEMDRITFANPGVIEEMADRYVWLKLNTETEADGIRLQKEFMITGYPTILILDAGGKEVDRISGYLPPERFRRTVDALVADPESLGSLRKRAEVESTPEAYYDLAGKYMERRNYADAAAAFRRVTELDPHNRGGKTALSLYYLALALAAQRQSREALEQLELLEERFQESELLADAVVLRDQIHSFFGPEAK